MPLTKEQVDEIMQSRWVVIPTLEVPGLVPPAVMFAFFDQDPVPEFEASLSFRLDLHLERLKKAAPEDLQRDRMIHMQGVWDLLFRQVTGDNMHLLVCHPELEWSFGENSLGRPKWLVTRTVEVDGELLCWSQKMKTEGGSVEHPVLSRDSALDVVGVYERVVASYAPTTNGQE